MRQTLAGVTAHRMTLFTSRTAPRAREEVGPVMEANMTQLTNVTGVGGAVRSAEVLPAATGSPGVLVVDDEACVRDMLRIGMKHYGLTAWLAADGQEAINVYRRNRELINVALLDVRMPGLDGLQTMTGLHQLDPNLPCIFMTGDCGDHEPSELLARGAWQMFLKPFRLYDVVHAVLHLACETMGKARQT